MPKSRKPPQPDRSARLQKKNQRALPRSSPPTLRQTRSDGPIDCLPVHPDRFYFAARNLDSLPPPLEVDTTTALKRLGPLPLPKGRFPLLGFLATVYEQAAKHAREALERGDGPGSGHSDRSASA